MEHRLSALLQLHLHSRLNTWLRLIGQRQLQDETIIIHVLWFDAAYIRNFTVIVFICYSQRTWKSHVWEFRNQLTQHASYRPMAFIKWGYSWKCPCHQRSGYIMYIGMHPVIRIRWIPLGWDHLSWYSCQTDTTVIRCCANQFWKMYIVITRRDFCVKVALYWHAYNRFYILLFFWHLEMGFEWQPVNVISDRFLNIFIWVLPEIFNAITTVNIQMNGNECQKIGYATSRARNHNLLFCKINPAQYGHHFAEVIFRYVFANEKFRILIKISLKFVPNGPIDNNAALVSIVACRRMGVKKLSEPMLTRFIDANMRL